MGNELFNDSRYMNGNEEVGKELTQQTTEQSAENEETRQQCSWRPTVKGETEGGMLTKEKFKELTSSPDLKGKVAEVRHYTEEMLKWEAIRDAAEPGTEEYKEAHRQVQVNESMKRSKKVDKLPAITWLASFPDGTVVCENNPGLRPSTLAMIDLDYIRPEFTPKELWEALKRAGFLEDEQVALVHITPSGHGLRLVLLRNGRTLEEVMADFQSHYGAICAPYESDTHKFFDECGKKLERFSFVPLAEEILHEDDDLIWPTQEEYDRLMAMDQAKTTQSDISTACPTPTAESAEADAASGNSVAESVQTYFEDVALTDIARQYFILKYGGLPAAGNRHRLFLEAARMLAIITDCQPTAVYQALLPLSRETLWDDKELSEVVRDGIQWRRNNFNVALPRDLQQAIDQAQAPNGNTLTIRERTPRRLPLPKRLPPVLKQWVEVAPEGLEELYAAVALLCMGVAAGTLRAKYQGRLQPPALQQTLFGYASHGKSFIDDIVELTLGRVEAHDDEVRRQEYAAKQSRAHAKATKNDAFYEETPELPLQTIPPRTSAPELLRRLMNCGTLPLFMFSDEIGDFTQNNRRGASFDLRIAVRKGYDGGQTGADFFSDDSMNGLVKGKYIAALFAGNPTDVDAMYDQELGKGTISRTWFLELPEADFELPKIAKEFTEQQLIDIDEAMARAFSICYNDDGTTKDIIELDMDWLYPHIRQWFTEQKETGRLDNDKARGTFSHRSAVNGFRVGMICWWYWGCNPRYKQDVINLALWAAEHCQESALKRYGAAYNTKRAKDELKSQNLAKGVTGASSVLSRIAEKLPATYTIDEVREVVTVDGKTPNNNTVKSYVKRLQQYGYAQKTDQRGVYRKVA